jgi:hypothetical protein
VPAAVAVAVVAGLVALLAGGHGDGQIGLPAAGGAHAGTLDPLAYRPGLDAELTQRATLGYSHTLFARSPGGAEATARRVARFRGLIEKTAHAGKVDPDLLEAIVFLESAGRPDVIAGGGDPAAAAGLTQILAETGSSLLGMHVDLAASRRLTQRYVNALRHGRPALAARALAQRRRVDDRFDPAKALAGTVRYLHIARGDLHRDDLAVVSYHMGIGNLQAVQAAYGDTKAGYPRLFFDSTPLRHATAWGKLQRLGDDSATYFWRVLAAARIMRLYRDDPSALHALAALQTDKGSDEEVLHPLADTKVFAAPSDVASARKSGYLTALSGSPARLGFDIDARMGELAPRLGQSPTLYRALRPAALALAHYLGGGVRAISGSAVPLTMSSSVRDRRYQALLDLTNPEATRAYSLHTTGYAFDVLRRYPTRAQAVAFQFMLDRLQALNLLAWVREPAAIHMTASSEAAALPAQFKRD